MTDFAKMRRKRGWMNMKVTDIIHETWDTDTFILEDADDGGCAFDYIAGQYLTFRFDNIEDKPIVRSYTMSSSPSQPGFSAFTVKRVEGGVISNWLCDKVKVGDVLRARGPIGKFCYFPEEDGKNLFMSAGGSGVTPFVSIMREAVASAKRPEKMTLLVSYRTKKDLICWDTLTKLNNEEGVKVITTLTREEDPEGGFWHGRLSDDMLAKAIDGTYTDTTFMTCGPQQLMDLTEAHCKAHDVAPEFIKTESFES